MEERRRNRSRDPERERQTDSSTRDRHDRVRRSDYSHSRNWNRDQYCELSIERNEDRVRSSCRDAREEEEWRGRERDRSLGECHRRRDDGYYYRQESHCYLRHEQERRSWHFQQLPPDVQRWERDLLPPPPLSYPSPHAPFVTHGIKESYPKVNGSGSSSRKRLLKNDNDQGDFSKRHRRDESERGNELQQQRNRSSSRGFNGEEEHSNFSPVPSFQNPCATSHHSLPSTVQLQSRGGRGRGNDRGRGETRGRGHGEVRGRGCGRGGRRGRRNEELAFDMVVTRPSISDGVYLTKQAAIVKGNKTVNLLANYYKVVSRPNWCIYHYRVDFQPDEKDTRIKKKMLKVHGPTLGAYIFDGSSLYAPTKLHPDPMKLYTRRDTDKEKSEIKIRLVAELDPADVMYLHFFNIIVRKCLQSMELEELGRHFYDRHQAILIEAHHLELWPGYKTSMRNHEHDILLGVELTHKVLRRDNCLQMIKNLQKQENYDRKRIRDELVGNIVMTTYNRKTYRIDDIDWDTTPTSTFEHKGRQTTFIEYFCKYGEQAKITDGSQPMIVSRPKKRDFHRGMTGPLLLVPELCKMTGLSDEMRANHNLMRALAKHMHTTPNERIMKLKEFMQRLQGVSSIQDELCRWGLKFHNNLVNFQGHTIPKENILFGEGKYEEPNDRYDWNQAFRSKPMLSSIPLQTWVMIVPTRDVHVVERLVLSMQRVATPMKFFIANPANIRRIGELRPSDYAKAVDMVLNEYGNRIQMLFVILPRQVSDIYSAVKKRACIDFGVPSQCFVAKNAHNEKGLMSICTKLVVQMNAKLGGEPWTVKLPLNNIMVVGFDIHHCGKRRGATVGAMVASTSQTLAKYFNTISYHTNMNDLSEKVGADFTKCLHAYKKINNELPERIIMYRDGVGDGQLKYLYEIELKKILESLTSVYAGAGKTIPKFSFIVVTKRINTRLFELDKRGHPGNPSPGTVADDVITLPQRYDFFLISQYSRQGTVSPVSYNVLYDRQGLDPDKMQRLTFKLCHLYFNWGGTVAVPAPCQYARKLAHLTGVSLGAPSSEKLANSLYYL